MAVFFIADTHFGDNRILKYENRPFADTAEMDAAIIERWNSAVSQEDTVWMLGDFGAKGNEREILAKLKGHIRLVRGNHDTETNEYYRACGFEEVYDYPVVLNSFWILSHEPLYVCENMPYANLFGHVHGSPLYKDFSKQHFCASVERTDYTPVSFDKVKAVVLG